MLGPSWQPKAAAIAAVLSLLFAAARAEFDGDPKTTADWNGVVTSAILAAGLFRTRQTNVSSEDQGIK